MVIDDPVGEHLDVMGCNQYLGWYYGEPEQMDRIRWSSPYDKPLIMSEFGAGAVAGPAGATSARPSPRSYQAHVYHKQIRMLRRIPFLAGLSPWILKDFRTPRRVLPGLRTAGTARGWSRIAAFANAPSACCASGTGSSPDRSDPRSLSPPLAPPVRSPDRSRSFPVFSSASIAPLGAPDRAGCIREGQPFGGAR